MNVALKLFKYFDTLSTFKSSKISANSNNTAYIDYTNDTTIDGDPTVLWNDICFIEDNKQIWTHGKFWNCETFNSYYTKEEIDIKLSGVDNSYSLVLDDLGVLSCIKNGSDDGFTLSDAGVLALA